jgi:hypothetical protein
VDRREISDVLGRQMLGLLHQLERVDRRRGQDLLGPHIPRSDDGHRRNQAQADHGQGYRDDKLAADLGSILNLLEEFLEKL